MYIEKYSLLLDIKLMLMTLQIMVRKESTEGFGKALYTEPQKKALLDDVAVSMESAETRN